ncbi:hypothetical protein B0H16DRAFT_1892605 [Mycena metata]|uniref:Chromo domain-containing protein n=1 Tax=Mycena metata TaxID=1033252 RepID=A0AAD7I2T7_9AGAR|nr:hypothetical protein B0H16DRAFT_1892605 [Mycena metata]
MPRERSRRFIKSLFHRQSKRQQALITENEELRRIARAAGVVLDQNHAQMVLMNAENERLRQKLHAKKNKPKRSYTTGHARLMTGTEMQQALLTELQKKQMGELHKEMEKTVFPKIKKDIAAASKEVKAAERAAAKAAKALEKAAADATRGRARGRGRGRARGVGRAGRGCGRGGTGGRGGASSDEDTDMDSNTDSSDDVPSPDPSPSPSPAPSRAHSLAATSRSSTPTPLADSDDDEEDGDETKIKSINGHRWLRGSNQFEFQVLWSDKDITWEPLHNVNDCQALEDYLTHRDVVDPLRLPKRRYLIIKGLVASNE